MSTNTVYKHFLPLSKKPFLADISTVLKPIRVIFSSIIAAEEQRNRPTEESRRAKPASKRLSFREQQEFAALDAEIPALESEKAELEALLSSGTLPHEELTRTAERIGALIDEIDEKTMRWLELSERA